MSILLTGVSLFKWIRSFSTSARFNLSFLNGFHFYRLQVALVFPTLPPFVFLQGLRFLNQVSFHWWEISPFFSVNVLIMVILRKILTKLQVHHSSFLLSSPVDSNQAFGVDHILSSFQKFYHAGAPHNHPLFTIHLFRCVQDILSLLSHSSLLILPVHPLF